MTERPSPRADPLRPVLRIAWGFVATVACILVGFLLVSVFLPSTWQVSRTAVLETGAQEAFRLVSRVDAWDSWMFWPELRGEQRELRGEVGDRVRWDDPGLGDGILTLTAAEPDTFVAYGVEIEGGAIRIEGTFRLRPSGPNAVRVEWNETGDFGWNPFLRYMALGMPRMQGAEMEKALARLREVTGSDTGTAPAPDA